MENLFTTLNKIKKENYNVNVFNVFLSKKNIHLLKFNELYDKIKTITTFEEAAHLFTESETDLIRHIKGYVVKKNKSSNYIFLNPNDYKIYEHKQLHPEENGDYKTKDNFLTFKIIKNNKNTSSLIKYLTTEENFIYSFVKKQNAKKKVSTKLWKSDAINTSEPKVNLDIMNHKNDFSTKTYIKTKKKYTIKKILNLEFNIENEKITTNARLSLPNSLSICLKDYSYLYLNKIIISETLTLGSHVFKNIIDKAKFIFDLYQKFFNYSIKDDNIGVKFNLTAKKVNISGISCNRMIIGYNDLGNNLQITNKNFIIKYISSPEEFEELVKKINNYENSYNLIKNFYQRVNSDKSLFLDDELLNDIFRL